jgi:hypothetical protein
MYTISENHTSGRRINIATAELHAPNQFTQKLKLMGKSGLCIYASTLPPSRVAPSGLLDCNFCLKLHYLGLEIKTSWLSRSSSHKSSSWWGKVCYAFILKQNSHPA